MFESFLGGRLTSRCTRWTPNPVPDEICFESIKTSLDAVPEGSKMLINSGELLPHPSGLAFAERSLTKARLTQASSMASILEKQI